MQDFNHSDDLLEHTYLDTFRKLYAPLLFYARQFLSQDQAEDIVQDAFVDLWERRDITDIGGQISAFLYRSVYYKCINVLKHQKIQTKYCAAEEEVLNRKLAYYHPDQEDVVAQMENEELRTQIFREIEKLPERCKEVFLLSYLQEMKNQEIATLLGISVRTVEAHMYKALKLLRTSLGYLVVWTLIFLCFSSFRVSVFAQNIVLGTETKEYKR